MRLLIAVLLLACALLSGCEQYPGASLGDDRAGQDYWEGRMEIEAEGYEYHTPETDLDLPAPGPPRRPTPISAYHVPPCMCNRNRYNCKDFRSQREAQSCYNYCKNIHGKGDIHWLDDDKDGKACEWLR